MARRCSARFRERSSAGCSGAPAICEAAARMLYLAPETDRSVDPLGTDTLIEFDRCLRLPSPVSARPRRRASTAGHGAGAHRRARNRMRAAHIPAAARQRPRERRRRIALIADPLMPSTALRFARPCGRRIGSSSRGGETLVQGFRLSPHIFTDEEDGHRFCHPAGAARCRATKVDHWINALRTA